MYQVSGTLKAKDYSTTTVSSILSPWNWHPRKTFQMLLLSQSLVQLAPMVVTKEGISICANKVQSQKAPLPMAVNKEGISNSIDANNKHSRKEFGLMVMTKEGISWMDVNKEKPAKEISPVAVTKEGISIGLTEKQPLSRFTNCCDQRRDVNHALPLEATNSPKIVTKEAISIDLTHDEPLKADLPMVVTKQGILNLFNANNKHSRAYVPMVVTKEGISIDDNDPQAAKADSSMVVTKEGISINGNDKQLGTENLPVYII
jgi:hypothetical protein